MQEFIENSAWKSKLISEFQQPYFKSLEEYIKKERQLFTVYPKPEHTFNALNLTSFEDVKVVIIGQDPYHGANQAHGLSFSVNYGMKTPPSLANIYKELKSDIDFSIPSHGNLTNLGNTRCIIVKCHFNCKSRRTWKSPKKRLGNIYRRSYKTHFRTKKSIVCFCYGETLPKAKIKLNRFRKAPSFNSRSSVSLSWRRFLRIQAFFQNERVFDFKRY
jgi:uracil-DNA glycosylase